MKVTIDISTAPEIKRAGLFKAQFDHFPLEVEIAPDFLDFVADAVRLASRLTLERKKREEEKAGYDNLYKKALRKLEE